jgi:hypothetical protein
LGVKSGRRATLPSAAGVFLNVPYDKDFVDLFLAYVAGVSTFRLVPHAALEIPGGERRLDRVFNLLRTCAYSIHDLSRVQLDSRRPLTPRMNMPFELGLAVAWEKLERGQHIWHVFETKRRRVEKSLSDIGGTDVYIHDGRPLGIFRELCNAFIQAQQQPTVEDMNVVYQALKTALPELKRKAGSKTAFQARVFSDLCTLGRTASAQLLG